jgi:fumarylacetoacetase
MPTVDRRTIAAMTDLGSYLEFPADTGFGLDNLPYGIGSVARSDGSTAAGSAYVAVGDDALDLAAAHRAGIFDAIDGLADDAFGHPTLNRFMGAGRPTWQAVRQRIGDLLTDRSCEAQVRGWLTPRAGLNMHLPVAVGDYVDFYSSEHHATNLGRILRPGTPPLLPNWRHLPVGYHGRAGTVVVSGTDIVRPQGLVTTDDGPPRYEPTSLLDIELEVGTIVGVGSELGRPIPIERVADHLFGMVLLNDWSARDIQAYEYQPLGPHLGKSFATSISPWVVPFAALEPFLVDGPAQDPAPAGYLTTAASWGLDLQLHIEMTSAAMRDQGTPPMRLSSVNFSTMYWTVAQQLAHLTANGASTRTGDLFGSGTVSGSTPGSEGSLIEITRRGAEPIVLPSGEQRGFLADGDEVILGGSCATGNRRIDFGEVRGTIVPAT